MDLSIIIPTLNEEQYLVRLLKTLKAGSPRAEIIVVDGGSTDNTLTLAASAGVALLKSNTSRARQLNVGAQHAKYDNLYFVHADTLPPANFHDDIKQSMSKGFHAACYRSKFEGNHPMFWLNSYFTRFPWLVARGGDQSLFITRSLFNELGTFNENMEIMEEYPLIETLLDQQQLRIIPNYILISTRKYKNRGWLKVSRANYIVWKMFRKGEDSGIIKKRYKELLS